MYDVLSSRKKKLKRFPSLKFRRSKSEICRPPSLEIGSSWARYFRSGNSTCDVIYLTRDCRSLDFIGILVGFWLKYLRNFCRAQFGENLSESSSEGCSESSEASFNSARVDDDSAEPIATEEEATQLDAEQIAV